MSAGRVVTAALVVVPGPVEEFLMGSPPGEAGRRPDEVRHRQRIGRTFALDALEERTDQLGPDPL